MKIKPSTVERSPRRGLTARSVQLRLAAKLEEAVGSGTIASLKARTSPLRQKFIGLQVALADGPSEEAQQKFRCCTFPAMPIQR